ncbi:uncharacterized protein BDR25DRAFT_316662 [Lindgomyces ingoldianus]|uniref:Uncharacterized protein n=1 Tax=Lindgomyces ingoldianus TaxID=673940 RepID=A0ACB6QL70_9PLEO|nr:uncharacterized protein BDR25DRAFT_316662 [Lindgomyces ingoldianus]KAF2467656.1 hypothetical protein BDR25DRAFT_316662 [Lindgomyces ingoldianus]
MALWRLRFLARILIAVQILVVLVAIIVLSVQQTTRNKPTPSTPPSHSHSQILAVLAWGFIPTRWTWMHVGALTARVDNMKEFVAMGFIRSMLYLYFALIPYYVVVFIVLVVTTGLNAGAVVMVVWLPCWTGLEIYRRKSGVKEALGVGIRWIFLLGNIKVVALVMLVTALMYFVKFFDGVGTRKRGWSDVLG